jgi:uncharacterized membrane protein
MDFSVFNQLPHEIATLLIALIPIGELRASIPIGILVYDLPWWSVYIFSVIGNMLPVFFLLWWLEPVYKFFDKRSAWLHRFFEWVFTRTRRKLAAKVAKHGWWALMLFVMIPLPITGAWTGSAGAFIFGIKYKKALLSIFLGVLISGVIVTLITLGAYDAFEWLIGID